MALAGCGLGPDAALETGRALTGFRASAVGSGETPVFTPDYQQSLTRGSDGQPDASWFDVRGMRGSENLDAKDLAGLDGGDQGFYQYLTQDQGPVAIYVGGVGEEDTAWTRPVGCFPGMPSLVLDYALNGYVGPGRRFWWPFGRRWETSFVPFDGIEGIPNYGDSVHYGAYLLDCLIRKLEAAGCRQIRVLGHSKGSDVCGNAVYNPDLHLDRRTDPALESVWTFAMPFISPYSPTHWGGHSAAPHWGGFFKTLDGKLVIYNRENDFTTYGGWQIDMAEHDYIHLLADSWLAPYAGSRGTSPAWSPTENFMSRLAAFATSPATSDQSPEALSYDW